MHNPRRLARICLWLAGYLSFFGMQAVADRPLGLNPPIPALTDRVESRELRGAPVVRASEFQASYQQPADNARQPSGNQADQADQAVIAAGREAFNSSCTTCHDAERATGKSKDYAGWLSTVRRMAAKDGADIRPSDIVPIATYLASLSGGSAGNGESGAGAGAEAGAADAGGWSFGTTVSAQHRSASDEFLLENPGFFADVWVTAAYQSSGPWRATVTACTSCHSTNSAINAYSLELVEGSATLDLRQLVCGTPCDDGREILLKAGRFVVPFGGFAAMSHPGIYRTVTNPLLFNMGRRVFVPNSSPPQQPVLPLPFADEGVDLMFRGSLGENLTYTLDLYAVNGLQGPGPNIFNRSRLYSDNNEEPSTGGRLTLGGDHFRMGTSLLQGNLQDQGLPAVDYLLAGADATAQLTDRLRIYFEYAMRRQDSTLVLGTEENTYGIVAESEYRLFDRPQISLIGRYDTLEHRNQSFGDASLRRFTWGLNVGLKGGSLLLINHERWSPANAEDVDVIGVRLSVSL